MDWWSPVSDWVWDRHANPLSWYIRPLFLLPFMAFAYRRNGWGVVGTLLALATSMFWFPAPAQPDPQIASFLAAEREYLGGEWTVGKVALTLLVPASLWALGAAFWYRSVGWGLVVLNAIAVVKTVWSVVYDDGGVSVVAPALVGLLVANVAVILADRWVRHRRRRAQHGSSIVAESTVTGA